MRCSLRILVAAAIISAIAFASGCNNAPEQPAPPVADGDPKFPKIRTVKPSDLLDETNRRIFAHHLYVPLATDLREAWTLTEPTGLNDDTIARWRVNGMRVGTIDQAALAKFMDALPRDRRYRRMNLSFTGKLRPLEVTPHLPRGVEVALNDPAIEELRTVELPPGRTQFLLHAEKKLDHTRFELTPHHHWVSPSLLPKSPQEKLLDGHIFEDLRLWAAVPRDRFLIITYEPPVVQRDDGPVAPRDAVGDGADEDADVRERPDAPGAPTAQNDRPAFAGPIPPQRPVETDALGRPLESRDDGDANGEASDEDLIPPPPPAPSQQMPTLGRLLLTAEWRGKPVQIVVILSHPFILGGENDDAPLQQDQNAPADDGMVRDTEQPPTPEDGGE